VNYELIEVYEKKKQSRWGVPFEGQSSGPALQLEDVVIGDPDKRDENREAYVADRMNDHLEKLLAV
jgi:hypothetical protein